MLSTVLLITGLLLNALMAGLYFAFTTAVMPGLARADARTYVTTMQRINAAIQNPWFITAFLGALIVPVVAVFAHLGDTGLPRLPWIIAGTVAYGITLAITAVVNVPLNNRLDAAGSVDDDTAPAVRAMYHDHWTRFNALRTVLSTAAVIALAIGLSRPV